MFKKTSIKKYIKNHPEIFCQNEDREYYSISDKAIPDIGWFSAEGRHTPNKRWYLSKRIMVPVALLLVFGVFFGATSQGRAMAEQVYNTVVQWVSGSGSYYYGPDVPPPLEETIIDKKEFESVSEVKEFFDVRVLKSDIGILDVIKTQKTGHDILLFSSYSLEDNITLTIQEAVYPNPIVSGTAFEFGETAQLMEASTADGIVFTGYVENQKGYAVASINKMDFTISAYNVTYDQFIYLINNIRME